MELRQDQAHDLDADARYYQEIQEAFVARRGAPLSLSSADWTLARSWRRAGIPLRIVLRGIADAMDGHAESWSRDRRVYHLKFCTKAVKAAQQRWHSALSTGGAVPLSDHRARLAAQLELADGLPSRVARERDRILRALHREDAGRLSPAELDRWLQSCERSLTRAIRAGLPAQELDALDRDVDSDLAAYRERMPEQILNDVRNETITRVLLTRYALPRLSLFHAE